VPFAMFVVIVSNCTCPGLHNLSHLQGTRNTGNENKRETRKHGNGNQETGSKKTNKKGKKMLRESVL